MLAIAYMATKWVGMFATRHGRSGKKITPDQGIIKEFITGSPGFRVPVESAVRCR